MLIFFVVAWLCGCGCETLHRRYFGRHDEALELVGELQRDCTATKIWIFRLKLPRRKEAILLALNEAAGVDVELEGGLEQLACFVREGECDCEEEAGEPPKVVH